MYKNIDTDTAGVALWEVGCFLFFLFRDNAKVNFFFVIFFNSLSCTVLLLQQGSQNTDARIYMKS